jgi:hypothetical protein
MGEPASASGSNDNETSTPTLDVEWDADNRFLMNHSVKTFSWTGLTVTVKDRQTKEARDLINDISGDVQQGMLWNNEGIQLGSCLYKCRFQ